MKQVERKKEWKIKGVRAFLWCISVVAILVLKAPPVTAARTVADMAAFKGVTVSPDGTAWTTDYLDRTNERLEQGDTVSTGVTSSLRALQAGEHYYDVKAEGSIPIGRWEVAWPNAQCIHEIPYYDTFCGFPIKSDTVCYSFYNNGWYAYCADCGEVVEEMLFYGTKATMQGITSVPAGAMYLYICPYCEGLEQGRGYPHTCKAISSNYYEVSYEANAPVTGGVSVKVTGFMAPTRHMYNNASAYNGVDAAELGYSDTHLRPNSYSCPGYKFVGWNTKADGSGTFFADGAAVINLTGENGGTVPFYAQWQKTKSTLVLDADGGKYDGQGVYERTQEYGTTYKVNEGLLTPAAGYVVGFETNGGNRVSSITTTKSFSHWEQQGSFQGSFQQQVYTFYGADGSRDTLKARYTNNSFRLPDAVKEDASLAGWYSEPDLSEDSLVGKPGEEATVDRDTTLYAKWATLTLWAYDDYESNGGCGAVDLKWEQKDGQSKYYRLFQSLDQKSWKEIFAADSIGAVVTVTERFGTDKQGSTFVVEENGYYTISAYGAKGADYSTALKGGAGGSVAAEYWLQAGDVVTFYAGTAGSGTAGGSNGSGSGGGASETGAGRGGGAATEVYVTRSGVKTLLLVAGGGAGANQSFAGGAGGANVTAPGTGVGASSAFGGGGGGALGGAGGGSETFSTLADTEDYAFRSNLSANLSAGTVQVYGMLKEEEAPSLNKVEGTGQNSWKYITKMGGLSSSFLSSYSLWYDREDCAFYGSSTGTAGVGKVPYIQTQVRDGINQFLYNTYNTSGNTNLLVAGGLYREDYGAPGHTYLRLKVTNADNGAVLYNNLLYHGYSGNSKTGIAAVVDIDVSTASRVTVQIISETEGTQDETSGHKTQLYFSDLAFYGKKVSTATATTGGSSYINTSFGCKNQGSSAGTNADAGYAVIQSVDIGYKEVTSLADVTALDTAAPNAVEAHNVSIINANQLKVTVEKPEDRGTTYYHLAKSFRLNGSNVQQLAVSNVTANTLTTGVSGYYYYVDAQSVGAVDTKDRWIAASAAGTVIPVTLTEPVMYLHVAAVDGAGNVGAVKHIRLQMDASLPTDPTYPKTHALYTEQMALTDSDFVHPAGDKTYYVKADGVTEHRISAAGYVEGGATRDYQVDSMYLKAEGNGSSVEWLQVTVPHGDIAESGTKYANNGLTMAISADFQKYMQPQYTGASRSNHCINLLVEQTFTVAADCAAFTVYPQASAIFSGQQYHSEEQTDRGHGLVLIPDGIPPTITGLEELAAFDILDMTEQSKVFTLSAEDSGSGLREFIISVSNKDNLMKEEFIADSFGRISLEIDKGNALFMGEIVISAMALDYVGNANIVGEDGLTFTLETDLYKERNPSENVFKTGDGAVLEIKTAGYVEKLELVFPEELLKLAPNLPLVYEYRFPYLRNTETVKFQIPLGIPEQEYEITVKAYKNGEMLVSKQTLVIVEGSVLDELRTRIRNNG